LFVAGLRAGVVGANAVYADSSEHQDHEHHSRHEGHEHRRHAPTRTPIKHLIVLLGENRTFDHVYGIYVPRHGQSVSNLLSKCIVNADGSPGPRHEDRDVGALRPAGFIGR